MQIIFQDPYACLNPRLRIQNIIAEPLKFHERLSKKEREERVKQVMSDVGLTDDIASLPMFYRFGLIDVPENVKEKMRKTP